MNTVTATQTISRPTFKQWLTTVEIDPQSIADHIRAIALCDEQWTGDDFISLFRHLLDDGLSRHYLCFAIELFELYYEELIDQVRTDCKKEVDQMDNNTASTIKDWSFKEWLGRVVLEPDTIAYQLREDSLYDEDWYGESYESLQRRMIDSGASPNYLTALEVLGEMYSQRTKQS